MELDRTMHTQPMTELGEAAIGTIGPGPRIETGEIDQDTAHEVAQRVNDGEFNDPISDELGPNAAGGTFTLVIADALTNGRFRQPGANAAQHAESMYVWLKENKNDEASRRVIPRVCVDGRTPVPDSKLNKGVIGVHDDDHGPAGCGAQSKLGPILSYIAKNGDVLRQVAESKGVVVDDATHQKLVGNAAGLLSDGYVVPGEELRDTAEKVGGEESVTTLAGLHNEIGAKWNKDPDTTLNRQRLAREYGDKYEMFNVDAGVFPEAAAVISLTEQEAMEKAVAMAYYNEATALVLGHETLLFG